MQHFKIINCLDIGTSKITAITGQFPENESKINIVGVASIPAVGFKKGQIINLEQASKTITDCIESTERMAGFQINHAYVSLTAPHLESINSKGVTAVSGSNGEITPADIERAVEAAKAISLPVSKEIVHVIPRLFTVDGQEGVIDPVGMNGIRLEVETHLILASTPALKNLYKCLENIGIKVDGLVYSGLSAAKACLTETETELGVALVDIGGSNTTLTIFQESSPIFSGVIPIGANNITNDLAIGLRLPLQDSEKIKIKLKAYADKKGFEDEIELTHLGVLGEDKKKISFSTTVNGIIKARLEEIFGFIYDQIEDNDFKNSIPAGIVLTGGGSQTILAKEVCSDIIPLPVRIAEPPRLGGLVDDITNPAFASTIGTILYFQNNKSTVKSKGSSNKSKVSFDGILGKLKSFIEPLLP
ncbi:MAG: cell division protein FtsA [Patescibacteria group bacterium]|jgi:cell division protein FtsA|nr:cell division protein FtsA [Candidatus Shapirobacteria bacterium]